MTDLYDTIRPKSDQLNADDLICGPITIKVTEVNVVPGEQPVEVHYEGDGGRPYKPGLSMRRVLVYAWGRDSSAYVGKRMRLFRDPEIVYGGQKVGGIRISHMSHLKGQLLLTITASQKRRIAYKVEPLEDEPGQATTSLDDLKLAAEQAANQGNEGLKTWWEQISAAEKAMIKPLMVEYKKIAAEVVPEQTDGDEDGR